MLYKYKYHNVINIYVYTLFGEMPVLSIFVHVYVYLTIVV